MVCRCGGQNAVALAVLELRKGTSFIEAEAFAQKALEWVGQTLNKWLWS
jgi:hypothetical protein